MRVVEEKRCRICRGELKVILDFGYIVPSGFTEYIPKRWETAPLVLAECEDCKLVQLKHTIDLDLMYRQYWYASSLNKSMISSLKDIVDEIKSRAVLEFGDDVLDIGCNDGTLLSLYDDGQHRYFKTGFDPALNIIKPDHKDCDYFINTYFDAESWEIVRPNCKAKVVTAIAMFYDLPDPHKFVEDVAQILHEDGIFVIQFTDLLSMYTAAAFDNICHEHLEYYKLADVKFLLESHGLEIIDVSYNKVNGGSIRVTAAHEGRYPVTQFVKSAYDYEDNYMKTYGFDEFARQIQITKVNIYNFLSLARTLEKKVFLLGASTKGNTLLQVCNITKDFVPYAAEVNKEKFGLRTAGSGIYIIPEVEALFMNPDFFFVPVWHFKHYLLNNRTFREYITQQDGKLVFPLPVFEVIGRKELEEYDKRQGKDYWGTN